MRSLVLRRMRGEHLLNKRANRELSAHPFDPRAAILQA